MKFHGDINLQDNTIQRMVIQAETNFPSTPIAGRIVFKDKRLYICAEIAAGVPAWLPLTSQLDSYIFQQEVASDTWTITHGLNCTTPAIQFYDDNYQMVFPDTVTTVTNNQIVVKFGVAFSGRAIAIAGQETGVLRDPVKYTETVSSLSTTWVINHGLGYIPTIRAFNGADEITPSNITHNSNFKSTLTFSSSQSGYATAV